MLQIYIFVVIMMTTVVFVIELELQGRWPVDQTNVNFIVSIAEKLDRINNLFEKPDLQASVSLSRNHFQMLSNPVSLSWLWSWIQNKFKKVSNADKLQLKVRSTRNLRDDSTVLRRNKCIVKMWMSIMNRAVKFFLRRK